MLSTATLHPVDLVVLRVNETLHGGLLSAHPEKLLLHLVSRVHPVASLVNTAVELRNVLRSLEP